MENSIKHLNDKSNIILLLQYLLFWLLIFLSKIKDYIVYEIMIHVYNEKSEKHVSIRTLEIYTWIIAAIFRMKLSQLLLAYIDRIHNPLRGFVEEKGPFSIQYLSQTQRRKPIDISHYFHGQYSPFLGSIPSIHYS